MTLSLCRVGEHLPSPPRTYRSLASWPSENLSRQLIECLQTLSCVCETTLQKYSHLPPPDNAKDLINDFKSALLVVSICGP